MCDCNNSFGWFQSHSSCWADTILMTLLIPSLNKYYFTKMLKKINLDLDDFYPCKQNITNCEKEYLIRKIWGKEFTINKPSITHDRLLEVLKMINNKNEIINGFWSLETYTPKGNMFCIVTDRNKGLDEIKNYILLSVILAKKKHVVCNIKCDNNKWYYYDNERSKENKKLKLIKIKSTNNILEFKKEALLYYFFYTRKL